MKKIIKYIIKFSPLTYHSKPSKFKYITLWVQLGLCIFRNVHIPMPNRSSLDSRL